MDKNLLIAAAAGAGIYLLLRKRQPSLRGLGATPEVHRQEAMEDLAAMRKLVEETEENVRRVRCKDALASAGKAAVAAGKVERNLEYASTPVRSTYRDLNARRMASRDAFAAACMRQ